MALDACTQRRRPAEEDADFRELPGQEQWKNTTPNTNPPARYLLYRVLEPLGPCIVGTWRVREILLEPDPAQLRQ